MIPKTGKIVIYVLTGIIILIVLAKLLTSTVLEPLVKNRIEGQWDGKNGNYLVRVDRVHISLFPSRLEFKSIKISSSLDHPGTGNLNAEIGSLTFDGIKIFKALIRNEIDIREVTVSKISINGKNSFSDDTKQPVISDLNLSIARIHIDKIILEVEDILSARAYYLNNGELTVRGLEFGEADTLSLSVVSNFDFKADRFHAVSGDSLYSFIVSNVNYSGTSNSLMAESLYFQPNYSRTDFMALHKFEIDYIDAGLSNISVHQFSSERFLESGRMVASYIEIGNLDVDVFRDKRLEFEHVRKPAFQELIYNYPSVLNIDSIAILGGQIIYTEHAEEADNPGIVSFKEVNVNIYNISNDTIYKTESSFLKLNAEAMIMGKGRIAFELKARLFDRQNTFSMNGSLRAMEAAELNPMLENNAFVSVTSGRIEAMYFNFMANDHKATGDMILLYDDLKIRALDSETRASKGLRERVLSFIANLMIIDSNPVQGRETREGVIEFERDPERSVFNYWYNSLVSGIKSTITRSL
jgi:hypothetical protein